LYLQEYSGAALDRRIDSKTTGIPEIVKQITEQQADLGKAPLATESPGRPAAAKSTAGVIAGAVIGGVVGLALVALALLVLRRRRRAAQQGLLSLDDADASYDEGDRRSGHHTGPVGEATEDQPRTPRSGAALQRHASADVVGNGALSRGRK
jgi:hypothetical protein